MAGTFNRAIKSKLFEHSVDSIVKVYLARADFHRRVFETMRASLCVCLITAANQEKPSGLCR